MVGYELAAAGVGLDPVLARWGTGREAPAASIGTGRKSLVDVAGSPYLALCWDFGASRAFATTRAGTHLAILMPTTRAAPALARRG